MILDDLCLRYVLIADASATNMDVVFDFANEKQELISAFKSGGIEACRRLLEKKRDEWKNIPLNVAVIGNSGVGKSSFINAIRRLTADDRDRGAAEVGVKATTADIKCYAHPNNPLLKFWDLPGVGTKEFPKETYLAKIVVDRYDFFLLITATRFTENDTWLGKEIRERKKKYFFVRTKTGLDISNNKLAHPRTHNEEAVKRVIRESTEEHLRDDGCDDVPVFLIDSYEPWKFQFGHAEQRLINEFPKLKTTALILSLDATSKEMIQLKVAELRKRIWVVAGLSGAVGAIPVLGVSLAFDIAVAVEEATFYYTQLGLDEVSLERYANLTRTNHLQLRAIVYSGLGFTCKGIGMVGFKEVVREGLKKLVTVLSTRATAPVLAVVVEEVSRFIPVIGSCIAAPLSFAGTCAILKLLLRKMESVALEVIDFATKSATDTVRTG